MPICRVGQVDDQTIENNLSGKIRWLPGSDNCFTLTPFQPAMLGQATQLAVYGSCPFPFFLNHEGS